ncbi:hypothetical protein CEXT_597081 [Caerostris extrusa]|uniref:Uncharacterized protein n=1 Tax=Caerostris extrusa TaxID=172846 RepID=A0AAV4XGN2_CAEEX|nr:hypothetical protein CEXT_597081 [Caerostris extrusa]
MRISNLGSVPYPLVTRGGIVETDQSGSLIGFDWQPDEGLMLARKQLLTGEMPGAWRWWGWRHFGDEIRYCMTF